MEQNIKGAELNKVIKEFNFEPNYGKLIITTNKVEDDGKLITEESALDTIQYVVASGPRVVYQPGDKILLNVEKLSIQQRSTIDATNVITRIDMAPFEFNNTIFGIIDENKIMGKYKN